MSRTNVSVAMKLGYMHAALTEDGDVLAECGVWHRHEDEECEVAENWVLVTPPYPTDCRACGTSLENCSDFPNHCCVGCWHQLPVGEGASTEEPEPQTTTLSCGTCGKVFGSVTRLDPTHEMELLMHCPHVGCADNSLAWEAGDVHVPGGTYALIEHLTIRHGANPGQCATNRHGLESLHARYHGEYQ